MVTCDRCGKEGAKWRCKVCGRLVCEECARPTKDGVYCMDHVPGDLKGASAKPRYQGSKAVKSLFFTLLVLTLGVALLVGIGQSFIGNISAPGIGFVVDALKSVGYMILGGLAFFTVLIGVAYYATRKKVA